MHVLRSLATAAIVATALSGCAHHTTHTERVDETVRTEQRTPPPTIAPTVTEESTTIRRSHTKTEEGQP